MLLIYVIIAAVAIGNILLIAYLLTCYKQSRREMSNLKLTKYGDELFIYDEDKKDIFIHF
jgi:hypothetical protein